MFVFTKQVSTKILQLLLFLCFGLLLLFIKICPIFYQSKIYKTPYLSFCLVLYLSIYLYVFQSIYPYICGDFRPLLSVFNLSIYRYIYLCINLSIYLYIYIPTLVVVGLEAPAADEHEDDEEEQRPHYLHQQPTLDR